MPGLARFGRIWRRFFFGAVLDRDAPRQELADGLYALLRGLVPCEFVLHPATPVARAAVSAVRGFGAWTSPSSRPCRSGRQSADERDRATDRLKLPPPQALGTLRAPVYSCASVTCRQRRGMVSSGSGRAGLRPTGGTNA